MSDRYFLTESPRGSTASLTGDEARHLGRVLRAKVGDRVRVFDGSGAEWAARIESIGRDRIDLVIDEAMPQPPNDGPSIILAVALPKGERQKWMVEKLTELGTTRLVPLETTRGVAEATPAAVERLNRGVVEACKQCGRSTLMEIGQPVAFSGFLAARPPASIGLLAVPGGEPVRDAVGEAAVHGRAGLFAAVGPEGGFTDEEIAAATVAGFRPVSLGPHVLRVETAAIALAAALVAVAGPPNRAAR